MKTVLAGLLIVAAGLAAAQEHVKSISMRIGGQEVALTPGAVARLACLPELAVSMPAEYRATCAKLTRGADGRIELPPPDIAPSCG